MVAVLVNDMSVKIYLKLFLFPPKKTLSLLLHNNTILIYFLDIGHVPIG